MPITLQTQPIWDALQEGIKHYILWASKALPNSEIESEIRAAFPDGKPTLWWVNPPELQSVMGVSKSLFGTCFDERLA